MTRLIPGVALLLLSTSITALAESNALTSCYSYAKLSVSTTPPDAEIFVMVDQTTPLNSDLKQSVADNTKTFLQPGNAFTMIEFSAFTQGHYTNVLVRGVIDFPIDAKERNSISKAALSKFDQCLIYQTRLSADLAGRALRKTFSESSTQISNSDIMANLKAVSDLVRSSPAHKKVVLLASDMLENSSISSFYSKKTVRIISMEKELKIAEDNQLIGDFGGADIYVIGAGIIADDNQRTKGTYRSPQAMQSIEKFWRAYFEKSNAQLVEFGAPALLGVVH